ncbi:hypothetical protein V6Z12_D13G174400 [Gossypium hirsutum]
MRTWADHTQHKSHRNPDGNTPHSHIPTVLALVGFVGLVGSVGLVEFVGFVGSGGSVEFLGFLEFEEMVERNHQDYNYRNIQKNNIFQDHLQNQNQEYQFRNLLGQHDLRECQHRVH